MSAALSFDHAPRSFADRYLLLNLAVALAGGAIAPLPEPPPLPGTARDVSAKPRANDNSDTADPPPARAIAWHYTTADAAHLGSIVRSGVLRVTGACVPAGERRAVWMTLSGAFEPTARKMFIPRDIVAQYGGDPLNGYRVPVHVTGHLLSIEEMHERYGLARIGIEAVKVPLTWADHLQRSGVSPRHARALERTAIKAGSDLSAWRISYFDLPAAEWLRVEIWDGERWVEAAS